MKSHKDSEFDSCFDSIKRTLPIIEGDGYSQIGKLIYNPHFNRIEICGEEGGWIGLAADGNVGTDLAPFSD